MERIVGFRTLVIASLVLVVGVAGTTPVSAQGQPAEEGELQPRVGQLPDCPDSVLHCVTPPSPQAPLACGESDNGPMGSMVLDCVLSDCDGTPDDWNDWYVDPSC